MIKNAPEILDIHKINKNRFMKYVKYRRRELHSINQLKHYISDKSTKTRDMNKIFRILAFKFMREESIPYMVNNKNIKNPFIFVKYRYIIFEALKNPTKFSQIKPFLLEEENNANNNINKNNLDTTTN